MKVFFCINSKSNVSYYQLLKQSIDSLVRVNKKINIYILTDDYPKNKLSNCTIIKFKPLLNDALKEHYNDSPVVGAYYRLEIPSICKEYNFKDPYVLYLDCDILCLNSPIRYLKNLFPKYFACNDEWNRNSMKNSGVMYINVQNMLNEQNSFFQFVKSNMSHFSKNVHDQTAINEYFKDKIDNLPDELNWKSYWGINNEASIIHFHWLKPNTIINKQQKSSISKLLVNSNNFDLNSVNYYNDLWEQSKVNIG